MADLMTFPKTVDEFMEQYKIVDSDEVYTNGAELVPIFRMKQWFEHVDPGPVKDGKWIEVMTEEWCTFDECKCSVCGDVEYFNKGWKKFSYCPNCGAKMREEGDNDGT